MSIYRAAYNHLLAKNKYENNVTKGCLSDGKNLIDKPFDPGTLVEKINKVVAK